jgi:uncharacterized metal-binding protein YceD (DUF177 family)
MLEDFDHKVALDRIRDGERIDLCADEPERQAIAERLGFLSLERLEAHAVLQRDGTGVRARGRVRAALEQSCVATGQPVAEHVDEAFDLLFVPEPAGDSRDEEIELGAKDCDVVFHDGGTIDIGAAIADTLALAVNPYPRSAEADLTLKDAGVISEEQAGPFAALAKLKKGGDEA